MGIDPVKCAKNLIEIFTQMIFKHGFIHCDAHPGNILVRKASNSMGHEIVLLDHGLYRTVDKEFVKNFSGLWLSLLQSSP
jgi:aarF domain-containing kinase